MSDDAIAGTDGGKPLLKSEMNLKKAEKIAKLGNWEWNIQTNELLWSDEVYRIYGADPSRDEASYDLVVKTVAPECRDRFVKAVEDAISRGAPFEGEYRMIGLDGKERFTHTIGEVVRDQSGRPTAMFGVVQDVTDYKKVEQALRESEEKFRSIYNNIGIGVALIGKDMKILSINRQMQQWFPHIDEGQHAVCYRNFNTPPRDSVCSYCPTVLTLHDGQVHRAVTDTPTESGVRHYRVISSPLLAVDGSVAAAIEMVEDITDSRLAETKLRNSEKQLAESQRIAHIGSWEHNLTTGEVVWSDELFRLLGLDPRKDHADFKMFFEMIHPDDRPVLEEGTAETVRTGKQFSIDYRFLLRDGSIRILHAQAELKRDESGAQLVLGGTCQDITERKQAEEKLRQGEQFIRGILDTVDEGFIVVDRDFHILTANKAYCGQVSRSCDDIIGRHCFEISHNSARPCYEEGEECAVRQVFATGVPHAVLHKHRDAEGHVLYVETKGFPVKDAAGEVGSVIETVNNITEKHLLEEERLKTQKLESIGTLAGGIAHDFNNLLQGIFGYIAMAKMTLDQKEKSLAMLEQAEKALHQSVNLTTQLLTFSKGGKPVKKPMSLEPVIEGSVKFALSGSRSEYQMTIDPGLWQVNGDAGQLGQVIQNIVLNADQAMPLGGIVKIAARNVPADDASLPAMLAPGNYVVLTIGDTGVGIPEVYLSKIFDPYFTTKEKGSGLGLATSYSIVRNHEGQIMVASEAGNGSVLSLYLPAITTRSAAETGGRMKPAAAPKARILVMDDEEMIRNLATELLHVLGHEVEVAAHGEAALATYREAAAAGRAFDLVILDLTIRGGMGGAETILKLREIDPQVKAVVSSGYSDDAAIADYPKQGFRAFLKKPYKIGELQAILGALLTPETASTN